ncbi:hypothetical protein D3C86_948080 [compost metagenome]
MEHLVEELLAQEHPKLGGVDVLVEVEHEVMRHDIVGRGEEGHQALDEMGLLGADAIAQVCDVHREVDLVGRPDVLEGVPVQLEELGVAHGAERELQVGVEKHYWQASQDSGFSSEQAIACSLTRGSTVVLRIRVLARLRK